MYRNQYDTDVTIFAPTGRLHQVEYASEAVKQGSCCLALRSLSYAVVASFKRQENELSSYQQKIFPIAPHCGIGVSGLISDARLISQYLRSECLNHQYVYSSPIQLERLIIQFSDKAQAYTQKGDKRPYGCGVLCVGYDKSGPHVYQTDPSGHYSDCYATAIGGRAQSARTYLEKVYEQFIDPAAQPSLHDLIKHSLQALKGAAQKKLTSRNCSVGYVGPDQVFHLLEGEDIRPYVGEVTNEDDTDEVEKKKDSEEEVPVEGSADERQRRDDEEEKAARNVQQELSREEMEQR